MPHPARHDPALPARFSVIVPTYRRAGFLEDTIASVLAQTHRPCEIIIVDDGSDEDTRRELTRLSGLSETIFLYQLPSNRGVAAARNYGLAKARGDYILFLDDDDLVHPKMLESAAALFEAERSVDVVTFLYEVFFTPESAEGYQPLPMLFNIKFMNRHPLNLIDPSNYARRELLEKRPFSSFLRFFIPVHTCLVRRASIGAVRFPEDLPQGEDTYFWLSLARQGCRFRFQEKVYAYIRRHGNNMTRSKSLYRKEIPYFYLKLLEEDMIRNRDDLFLVHLKLFYFFLRNRSDAYLRHFLEVCRCPDLLTKEILYWGLKSIRSRHRLFRYYFHV